jgi:HD-GYP domain-containing protein (c-di-GMP phosphodiesterase class II)
LAKELKALFIGDSIGQVAEIRECLGKLETRHISSLDDLMTTLESRTETEVDMVFTIIGLTEIPLPEMAQLLRVAFPLQPIYFVAFDLRSFDRHVMLKNGYTDAFLMPIDRNYLIKTVGRSVGVAVEEAFSAVRLVDIDADTKLDFEIAVFLPLNNKYVPLIHQGERLVRDRLERLKQFKQKTIFVPVNQMQAFYEYSARRLMDLEDGARSSTERSEKLQESIRDFVTAIVSASYSKHLAQGKQTTDSVRKVVEKYILLKNGESWHDRIMGEIGQSGDSYSHAGRVSTFAALFAIALRVSNAADLAVAGILHDLGITFFPSNFHTKSETHFSKEEYEQFKTHPVVSLTAMQERKLPFNDDVVTAVLQHHERFTGGGYPENLQGRKMKVSAQVLALADRFDYLTRVEANISPLDPTQAIERISAEGIAHPDLQNELRRIFKRLVQHKSAA